VYEADLGEKCWNLSGKEFEECKTPLDEVLEEALENCTPEEPWPCDEKAEEAYQYKLEECLASGADQANC